LTDTHPGNHCGCGLIAAIASRTPWREICVCLAVYVEQQGMPEGNTMRTEKKDEPSKSEGGKESPTTGNNPEESDPRKQPEPGAGGLSRAKYREATEKAVKDIHG